MGLVTSGPFDYSDFSLVDFGLIIAFVFSFVLLYALLAERAMDSIVRWMNKRRVARAYLKMARHAENYGMNKPWIFYKKGK